MPKDLLEAIHFWKAAQCQREHEELIISPRALA